MEDGVLEVWQTSVLHRPQPSGRWGEAETEKGLEDLFPTEPTDEPFMARRP